MIEQTGALGTTIQQERLYRDSNVTETGQRQARREQETTQESRSFDTVTLSAEAVALARNVSPAAAASETQESPAAETPAENVQEPQRLGTIDIQA